VVVVVAIDRSLLVLCQGRSAPAVLRNGRTTLVIATFGAVLPARVVRQSTHSQRSRPARGTAASPRPRHRRIAPPEFPCLGIPV
jgi:hypothetical protein